MKKDDDLNKGRFTNYLKFAPKITVPVTVKELSKSVSKKARLRLEKIIDKDLGPSKPARCTSAQYVDKDGEPLLFYFGRRLVSPKCTSSLLPSLVEMALLAVKLRSVVVLHLLRNTVATTTARSSLFWNRTANLVHPRGRRNFIFHFSVLTTCITGPR
jgi:hypothetical protein